MQGQFWGKVLDSGQVLIPTAYLEAFNLSAGDDVVITRCEYGIRIVPLRHTIQHAQEMVARYIPVDADLGRELREIRDQDGRHDE